jgi:hypothetical protein
LLKLYSVVKVCAQAAWAKMMAGASARAAPASLPKIRSRLCMIPPSKQLLGTPAALCFAILAQSPPAPCHSSVHVPLPPLFENMGEASFFPAKPKDGRRMMPGNALSLSIS